MILWWSAPSCARRLVLVVSVYLAAVWLVLDTADVIPSRVKATLEYLDAVQHHQLFDQNLWAWRVPLPDTIDIPSP